MRQILASYAGPRITVIARPDCMAMAGARCRDRAVGQPTPLPPLVGILPTRTRRNYRGGLLLDELERRPNPADSDRPESWIASTVAASNPGMPAEPGEGLTRVRLPDGTETTLPALVALDPAQILGAAHVRRHGTTLGFLAKLLDSAMRLHVQAHPTAAFARAHLGSRFGKLEVYYVLAIRPGTDGYVRLGFQRSPGRDRWMSIIAEQDIAAMDACFDPIPVAPGDVWIVPGGMPHAIGEGVLMVEVMEPSDLVVRCEFEREGVVVPPGGRFMGRDLDFCLQIFDYRAYSPGEIRTRSRLEPQPLIAEAGWRYERLVGSELTSCFELHRLQAARAGTLPNDGRCSLIVQTRGASRVAVDATELPLAFGAACFVTASARDIRFTPLTADAEWLFCRPA